MAIRDYVASSKIWGAAGVSLLALAPGVLKALPQTVVVSTVTPITTQLATGETGPTRGLNLSFVLKCDADATKSCSTGIHKVQFPGIGLPKLSGPDDIEKRASSIRALPDRDGQNRTVYEFEVLRGLKGGETLLINIPINGIVTERDIKLFTVVSQDLLSTKFACHDVGLMSPEVSKRSCGETFGLTERLVYILPYK